MKSFLYNYVVILFTILIAGSGFTQAQEPGAGDQLLFDQYLNGEFIIGGKTDKQELLERVREKKRIPVIVRLNVSFRPEGLLHTSAKDRQRQNIRNSREALFYDMVALNITSVKSYTYVPYVAMQVDENALMHLMESRHVVEIVEDEAVPPALMDSVPIIGADNAWSIGYSGDGYAIVILDTGVDLDHPFFAGKIVAGACFSSDVEEQSETLCPDGSEVQIGIAGGDDCDLSISGCGHGTHVAGIAAGSGMSPLGEISGVARDADIIAVQVFSKFMNSDDCGNNSAPCVLSYTSDQISALEWVYDLRNTHNIASVNMSLGGGASTTPCDNDIRKPSIDNLRSANIATVVASGNNGYINALNRPACISTAISVGSTTKTDQVSSFTNSASFLDLLAPGSSIYSAVPGGFGTKSGTSMAAPHVAGAWAVIREFKPDLNVAGVLQEFIDTGVSVLDPRNNIIKPRIQVDRAVGFDPAIAVDIDTFDEVVPAGGSKTRTLTVSNNGGSDLIFNMLSQPPAEPAGIPTENIVSNFDEQVENAPAVLSVRQERDFTALENMRSRSIVESTASLPDSPHSEDIVWVHYDGNSVSALGLEGGGTFTVAARFTADEFGHYYGIRRINRVNLSIGNLPSQIILKIWEGGSGNAAGTLIYEQDISGGIAALSWNEIILDEPVSILAGNEYRVGYTVTHAAEQPPAGLDQGPMVPDKGGWISFSDGSGNWNQLTDYGFNNNWNIRVGLALTESVDWITFTPVVGVAGPDSDFQVEVTFDAAELEAGVYHAEIIIISNDPVTPNVFIPVKLTVTDAEESTIGVTYAAGWNIVGLPLEVVDAHYKSLFPGAIDGTLYEFEGNYQPKTEMQKGTGYWMRFSEGGAVDIFGISIDDLTLHLTMGWNMISGLSSSVPLAEVNDPAGIIIQGTLYEFVSTYNPSTNLEPGKGYWIRANDDGQISMSAGSEVSGIAKSVGKGADGYDITSPELFDRIVIRDAKSSEWTLYFGSLLPEGILRESYSLPPVPPGNAFDVRFADGYFLSEEKDATVALRGESYPMLLTIYSAYPDEMTEYVVTQADGVSHRLSNGERIEIKNPDVRTLYVQSTDDGLERTLPTEYSLSQNYPNPFNPVTTIEYGLPKETQVKLEVYNMLGQRVVVMVDGLQEAGYYAVEFDASQLTSGVYVYKLTGGEFVDVKKFVYLK